MYYKPTAETLRIVERLGGKWQGSSGICRCPVPGHNDRKPSLSISQGRKTILVTCFAGCDRGAILDAIRNTVGGTIATQSPLIHQTPQRTGYHRPIWEAARGIEGTIAERYLKRIRGITFLPADVRYHPRCPNGPSPSTVFEPALLVGIFRHQELVAIQRIFLDPATAKYTEKKILGDSRGGSWPARFASPNMAIAEGFETACAYEQLTGKEAGTCFGTRNFALFEPPAGIERITFLPDNDKAGLRAAHDAAQTKLSAGYTTVVEACPSGYGDWADVIREKPQPSIQ